MSVIDVQSKLTTSILDTLTVAVLALDSDHNVLFANPMAETLLGRSVSLLKEKSLATVLAEHSPILDLVSRARTTGGSVYARDIRMSGPELTPVDVNASASLHSSEDLVVLSITPIRKPTEADPNRQTETMAEVARILGHEVKNPLAGMVGAAQLLARKARDDQHALLTLIREEGARIGRLVDRFAAFETYFNPRPTRVNVHEILQSVVDLSRASFASNMDVTCAFDPSLPELLIDSDHIHEACLNIIKNAADAIGETGKDGKIQVKTSYRVGVAFNGPEMPDLRAGAVEISIKDNGPGIPAHAKDKIFSPFFTTRQAGAGIGLSVVAEIISAHKGFIELETGAQGTCFKILLPITKESLKG